MQQQLASACDLAQLCTSSWLFHRLSKLPLPQTLPLHRKGKLVEDVVLIQDLQSTDRSKSLCTHDRESCSYDVFIPPSSHMLAQIVTKGKFDYACPQVFVTAANDKIPDVEQSASQLRVLDLPSFLRRLLACKLFCTSSAMLSATATAVTLGNSVDLFLPGQTKPWVLSEQSGRYQPDC